jgi:hypothetical protein
MQKIKLTALVLISISALSGCSNAESIATTGKTPPQSIANKSPEGDIYTMEYKLCGKTCDANTSQIVTWGKPTEIGIGYFNDRITQTTTKLITSIDKGRGMQTYFMVKSKGIIPGKFEVSQTDYTSPGQGSPLNTDRFLPAETYQNILVQSSGVDGKRKPIYGHIEIVSIKQIPRTPGDKPDMIAISTLKRKADKMYMATPGTIEGYLYSIKDKPDIVPQQVEPITWQSGQPPQIIPVKAW